MANEQVIEFKKFPTTRYQGSKRKILAWIFNNIKDLKFETALDGFGGSGSVSYLLKKMGKSVSYNDKLRFNYLIGKALIENHEVTLTDEDILNLLDQDQHGFSTIQDKFRGIYYPEEENKFLDSVVSNIINMNHYSPEILQYKRALSYYVLFQASIIKRPFNLFHRKNLNLRISDVKRNFGNKITWERSFEEYIQKFASELNGCIFNNGKSCRSINESIFEIDPNGYDLVYLDPPYVNKKNESSNYLKSYHFLEGIANYEVWESQIDYTSSNLRFKNISEQNEFKPSTVSKNFYDLIAKFKDSIIVLSYKVGGIPSIEELERNIKKIKKKVYTVSLRYSYALNKQNGNAELNREVLIIGI